MFNNLRTRLTVILVGLAVLPLLIIAAVIAGSSFSTLEQEALRIQDEKARHVTTEVLSFFEDGQVKLASLIEISGLERLTLEEQTAVLEDFLSFEDTFFELELFDSEQQEIIHISRTEVFTSAADSPPLLEDENIIQSYETQENYYSPVTFDETIHEPLMTMAIPISNLRTGRVAFVLVATMRVKPLWDLFAFLDYVGSEEIYLTDNDGLIIAHRDPSIVLGKTSISFPNTNIHAEGLSGDDVIMALENTAFGSQEFFIVAERPYNEAAALGISLISSTMILTGVVLVAAISLVILTVRQIVLPIENLSEAATALRDGNLSVRAEVSGEDEIGQLATSFNDMAIQLGELISGLEQRVAERTRDLEVAADVSSQVSRVLDMKQLLPYLVNTTRDGFNLAHASIFLYENETSILRLAASSGIVGRKMMEEGKQFHLDDKGLVPLTARTFEHQIINDVQASKEHFNNPLLPDTRSETTLPMRVGTRLIGVLDLQANEVNRFSDEQLAVLTTLADQIAIAVQNAELFTVAETARAEAERSDQVKSAFLASMSHELRTPLNSVINFTKFVVRGVMGPVTERQVETLNKVVASGQHLLALINDVLDMSKIESGSLNLFIEDDIEPDSIIQTVMNSAESLLVEKDIRLEQDIQADLPLMRADRKRITQILLNMISNACKFTERGFVKVKVYLEDDNLLISVQDTGPGIADEDAAAVFQSFLQTNTGLRQGEGTGLGMPISRSLAEAHGGKLWFESEVGKGTIFYVKLPIQSESLQVTT